MARFFSRNKQDDFPGYKLEEARDQERKIMDYLMFVLPIRMKKINLFFNTIIFIYVFILVVYVYDLLTSRLGICSHQRQDILESGLMSLFIPLLLYNIRSFVIGWVEQEIDDSRQEGQEIREKIMEIGREIIVTEKWKNLQIEISEQYKEKDAAYKRAVMLTPISQVMGPNGVRQRRNTANVVLPPTGRSPPGSTKAPVFVNPPTQQQEDLIPPQKQIRINLNPVRPFIDVNRSVTRKIFDKLVGESPYERMGLICPHCSVHNGFAFPAEFPFLEYTCGWCQKFVPSLMAKPKSPDIFARPARSTAPSMVGTPAPSEMDPQDLTIRDNQSLTEELDDITFIDDGEGMESHNMESESHQQPKEPSPSVNRTCEEAAAFSIVEEDEEDEDKRGEASDEGEDEGEDEGNKEDVRVDEGGIIAKQEKNDEEETVHPSSGSPPLEG